MLAPVRRKKDRGVWGVLFGQTFPFALTHSRTQVNEGQGIRMGSAESQSVVLSKEMGSSAPFHIFDILLSLAPYTKQVHESRQIQTTTGTFPSQAVHGLVRECMIITPHALLQIMMTSF